MIASIARALGKLMLLLVSTTFVIGVSLLLFGSYLLTWPVLRLSPNNRKIRSMVDLSAAALAALAAMQSDVTSDKSDNSDESLPVS